VPVASQAGSTFPPQARTLLSRTSDFRGYQMLLPGFRVVSRCALVRVLLLGVWWRETGESRRIIVRF
jgi:hypothetical protein